MSPLSKYLFAEIALDKRAYRLIEVVESDIGRAKKCIKYPLGVAFIAVQPVRTAKRGTVRSRLYHDRETWEVFLDKFFLTAKDVDNLISQALTNARLDQRRKARLEQRRQQRRARDLGERHG